MILHPCTPKKQDKDTSDSIKVALKFHQELLEIGGKKTVCEDIIRCKCQGSSPVSLM